MPKVKPDIALLNQVTQKTRLVLTDEWKKERRGRKIDFLGYCGLAQCIAGFALEDIEAKVKPFASQSLEDMEFNHVALTAKLGKPEKLYLIDPTFKQFDGMTFTSSKLTSPAVTLQRTPEGAAVLHDLLRKGYTELTPKKAQLYLQSLCNGVAPFETDEQAFAFLANPPNDVAPYRYENSETHEEISDRESLAAHGLRIKLEL